MSAAGELRAAFAAFVAGHALLEPGERLVVGVSGGLDSAVLLYLLAEGYRPVVAHVNYGLRPEADEDAAFVEALAARYGAPCHVRRATLPEGQNRQDAARRARYAFFAEVARAEGVRTVAVGHHRDDVAETLLLNLLRGAGPRGWAALPVARTLEPGRPERLIRPLRFAHRADLEAFARAERLTWREDASNRSEAYRRNVLRHEVMPLLQRHFGEHVPERLAAAADLAAGLFDVADFERARGEGRTLVLEALRALPEARRHGALLEALAAWAPDAPRSAATARRLDALLDAEPGRRVAFGQTTVYRDRETLAFARPSAPTFVATVTPGRTLHTPRGRLDVEEGTGFTPDPDPNVEVFDAEALAHPLVLRTWRDGDRLQPFGMTGSKLVSDVLTDAKVPVAERAERLVLTAGEALVWVVGVRRAALAPVTPATRRVLSIRWTPVQASETW